MDSWRLFEELGFEVHAARFCAPVPAPSGGRCPVPRELALASSMHVPQMRKRLHLRLMHHLGVDPAIMHIFPVVVLPSLPVLAGRGT
jgi:hypothetical protein